jgi:hypothetical protein
MQVGWDPISLYKEMGLDAKVFGPYLLLVLGFSLFKIRATGAETLVRLCIKVKRAS